ncbi:MAG: response regulator, partial [Epsilonproteobacteria bacterium]|nr:response regulator [Campylobacterota bacterium]
MKILILEDDDFIREEVKRYFEMKNHTVDGYSNADELFENSSLGSYDIFLFDINMPGLNGFETLKEIRSFDIDTPVIFITSMSDIDYVKEAYSLGCNDYIRKPFYFEELELRINKLLLDNNSKNLIKINEIYSFDIDKMELIDNENKEVKLNKNEKNLIYLL